MSAPVPDILKHVKAHPPARDAAIHCKAHKGMIADIAKEIGESQLPDALKAALQAELTACGAKAASVSVHRQEMPGPNGKTVNLHVTITPLF